MARAAAIIVESGRVALIERRNERGLYYVFPGGHVEEGETPEAAAVREVREELGLEVEVGRLVAEVTFKGRMQSFFAARVVGGEFGSGDGAEMAGLRPERGTYVPVWLEAAELTTQPVLPVHVAALAAAAARDENSGWPAEPLRYVER